MSSYFITDLSYFNSNKNLSSIYCNSNLNNLMHEFNINDFNFTHNEKNKFIKKIVYIFCQNLNFRIDNSKNNICINDFIDFNYLFENKSYPIALGENLFNIIYRSE